MALIRNPRFDPLTKLGLTALQQDAFRAALDTFFTTNAALLEIPEEQIRTAIEGALRRLRDDEWQLIRQFLLRF